MSEIPIEASKYMGTVETLLKGTAAHHGCWYVLNNSKPTLLGYISCLWKFNMYEKLYRIPAIYKLRGNCIFKHTIYGGIPPPTGSYLATARRASAATSLPSMGTPGAAATSWRPWQTLVSRLGRGERLLSAFWFNQKHPSWDQKTNSPLYVFVEGLNWNQ